jgi:hypothetical protein
LSITTLSEQDPKEARAIIGELMECLTAIVSNAQAGQRMAEESGVEPELVEVLSDIADDGKRAGKLLGRLDALRMGGGE